MVVDPHHLEEKGGKDGRERRREREEGTEGERERGREGARERGRRKASWLELRFPHWITNVLSKGDGDCRLGRGLSMITQSHCLRANPLVDQT